MTIRAAGGGTAIGAGGRHEPHKPHGKPMVRWFHPSTLVKTGVKAFLSAVIGKQADRRLLDALTNPKQPLEQPYFDCTVDDENRPRDVLWLDYVSDLGDGWNATYAVATAVMSPALALEDPEGETHHTQGGEVLVFGGDEVYPTASVQEYYDRTVGPYEAALNHRRRVPSLFAVPGNHDWYDGLVSFVRLFCQGRASEAWRTRQRRSYFAIKLPHGWWLLGTDMQLESDLDNAQVEFFKEVVNYMQDGERVILCNAEPEWAVSKIKAIAGRKALEGNLQFLEQLVLGKKVSIFLSGDLHHYMRHSGKDGRQKIIAGGGGAYLYPTHLPGEKRETEGFELRQCFPPSQKSRRLTWHNLAFPFLNPWFGVFMGAFYLQLGWGLASDMNSTGVSDKFSRVLHRALKGTGTLFLGGLTLVSAITFADARRGASWRWLAGGLHGSTHLLTAGLLTRAAATLVKQLGVGAPGSLRRDIASWLLLFTSGFLVAPFLVGLYLISSLNVFGCHANEAFSSLAIPDWKCFLRLRIDASGLTIYPVGIRRVPRAWKRGANGRDPVWVPDPADTRATRPELIEKPIVIGPTRALPVRVGVGLRPLASAP
ncbi:hypothetical protein JKA73_24895 [Myxococcus xanthus]|nr:hypothetical protein JKA73_24895 [Myxococcus xanthus]